MMIHADMPLSLTDAARALTAGAVSAHDFARGALDRLMAAAEVNAFVAVDAEAVLAAAARADRILAAGGPVGPLHGVPLGVKDNIDVVGLPCASGTSALREHRPIADAPLVARLMDAGALVLGKTGMHELAMGWTGQNPHTGPVRNPRHLSRMAGGSSGGSAAAVAAGIVPGALGTDTNGSIRVPAGFTGIAGLRPSRGRYDMGGIMPLAPSLDVAGPMAGSVADLALLDAAMCGARQVVSARGIDAVRLAIVPGYYFASLSRDVSEIIEGVLDRLRFAGVDIVTLDLPWIETLAAGAVPAIVDYESWAAIEGHLERAADVQMSALVAGLGKDMRHHLKPVAAGSQEEEAYVAAMNGRRRLHRLLMECFAANRIDAFIHPVTPMPAPELAPPPLRSPAPDIVVDGVAMPARTAFARNVTPASLGGLPSLTFPAGIASGGLPVGLQLDGPFGQDSRLLALGMSVETLLGGTN